MIVLLLLSSALAHVMWEKPAPRVAQSGIKGPYPCGSRGFHVAGDMVTTLAPGKQVLTIIETIKHTGAPMRIAISKDDDSGYDSHVLVTHIPHADNAGSPDYQLRVVVDIPNIDCPKCSLQLISVMTDKIAAGTCCRYPAPAGEIGCNSVYHSCANIKITGTGSVLPPSASSLPNVWTQESGGWSLTAPAGTALAKYTYDQAHVSFGANQCVCNGGTCTSSGAKGPTITPLKLGSSPATPTSTRTTSTTTTSKSAGTTPKSTVPKATESATNAPTTTADPSVGTSSLTTTTDPLVDGTSSPTTNKAVTLSAATTTTAAGVVDDSTTSAAPQQQSLAAAVVVVVVVAAAAST